MPRPRRFTPTSYGNTWLPSSPAGTPLVHSPNLRSRTSYVPRWEFGQKRRAWQSSSWTSLDPSAPPWTITSSKKSTPSVFAPSTMPCAWCSVLVRALWWLKSTLNMLLEWYQCASKTGGFSVNLTTGAILRHRSSHPAFDLPLASSTNWPICSSG